MAHLYRSALRYPVRNELPESIVLINIQSHSCEWLKPGGYRYRAMTPMYPLGSPIGVQGSPTAPVGGHGSSMGRLWNLMGIAWAPMGLPWVSRGTPVGGARTGAHRKPMGAHVSIVGVCGSDKGINGLHGLSMDRPLVACGLLWVSRALP